jgi:hypothetical protein
MFNWKQVAQRFDVDYERFRKFVSQRFPDLKPAETTPEVAQLFRTLNPVCRFGPDDRAESDKENDEDRSETADQPKKRSGLQRAAETYLRQMYQLRDMPIYFLRTEQIVFLSHVFYVQHNRSATEGPVEGALDFRHHIRRLKRHKVEIHQLSKDDALDLVRADVNRDRLRWLPLARLVSLQHVTVQVYHEHLRSMTETPQVKRR